MNVRVYIEIHQQNCCQSENMYFVSQPLPQACKDEQKDKKNTQLKTSWSAYQLRLICGEVWSSDVIIEAYLL